MGDATLDIPLDGNDLQGRRESGRVVVVSSKVGKVGLVLGDTGGKGMSLAAGEWLRSRFLVDVHRCCRYRICVCSEYGVSFCNGMDQGLEMGGVERERGCEKSKGQKMPLTMGDLRGITGTLSGIRYLLFLGRQGTGIRKHATF